MSKLDELIQQLCPHGVEFVHIGEVVTYEQPTKYIVKSTQYDDSYATPVLTAGQSFVLGKTNETNGIYNASNDNPVIIFDDFTGAFKWVDFPFKVKSSAIKILRVDEKKTTLRYIFHTMGYINFSSDEHKRLWIGIYSNICIPLPPLEVQQEIARILDQFTELTAELTTKLNAELAARKKQYEHYRDSLLTFDHSIPWVTIGEIATEIYRGSGIKRDEVTHEGIPCVRYGEIYTSYDISFKQCISHTKENVVAVPRYFEYGDIIFAITGESVDEIAKSIAYLGHERCMAGGDTVVLKHKQDPRYLSYALSTTAAQIQKSKGKVKSKVVHSSIPALREIKIPLPDLKTQIRIADILDTFYNLCNNTNACIPEEIETRRKQYEYYRDKLLMFKERKL